MFFTINRNQSQDQDEVFKAIWGKKKIDWTKNMYNLLLIKACLWWKVHLAYPASLLAPHSNT